jgi:hypothetical protein
LLKTKRPVNPILPISLSFLQPLARGSISSPIPRGSVPWIRARKASLALAWPSRLSAAGGLSWRADIVLVTLGDAKIDYRQFARACEGIIQIPVTSRHPMGASMTLSASLVPVLERNEYHAPLNSFRFSKERRPVTPKVAGSSPVAPAIAFNGLVLIG